MEKIIGTLQLLTELVVSQQEQIRTLIEKVERLESKKGYDEEDMREAFEWGVAHITFEDWINKFNNK